MYFLDIKWIDHCCHIPLRERESFAGKWNFQHNHTFSDRGDSVRQWLQIRTDIVLLLSWPMLLVLVHVPRTENSIASSSFPVLLEIFWTKLQGHLKDLTENTFQQCFQAWQKQSYEPSFSSAGPCIRSGNNSNEDGREDGLLSHWVLKAEGEEEWGIYL